MDPFIYGAFYIYILPGLWSHLIICKFYQGCGAFYIHILPGVWNHLIICTLYQGCEAIYIYILPGLWSHLIICTFYQGCGAIYFSLKLPFLQTGEDKRITLYRVTYAHLKIRSSFL